jgi:hypothetical protein
MYVNACMESVPIFVFHELCTFPSFEGMMGSCAVSYSVKVHHAVSKRLLVLLLRKKILIRLCFLRLCFLLHIPCGVDYFFLVKSKYFTVKFEEKGTDFT